MVTGGPPWWGRQQRGGTVVRESAEYDVLVVGGTGVDTVVRVDSLPVPLADSVQVGPIEE
jgi:hypothetical protein